MGGLLEAVTAEKLCCRSLTTTLRTRILLHLTSLFLLT